MPPRRIITPNRIVPVSEHSNETIEISEQDFALLTSLMREKGEGGWRLGIRAILDRMNENKSEDAKYRLRDIQAVLRENEAYFNSIGIELGRDLGSLGEAIRIGKQSGPAGPVTYRRKRKEDNIR